MTPEEPKSATQRLLEEPLLRERCFGSMQHQLYLRLKAAILDGRLLPGSRLPGARALAESLSVSRNTVTAAYDGLAAEGYVQPDRRGTRVANLSPAPAASLQGGWPLPSGAPVAVPGPFSVTRPRAGSAFRPGDPALSHFPLAAWRRAVDHAMRDAGSSALGYGPPGGEPALRMAIAHHLSVSRGVRCRPEQVFVTGGTQQALALCVRLLSTPGDTAWVEDPGYRGARAAMRAGGLRIRPIRTDAEGMAVSRDDYASPAPRLIYATPSHQYPTGAVLTVARRLELIEYARSNKTWIIEDDYDSEFRHAGAPVGAMQGLVDDAPVLYIGTFSKTLFPSLGMGFLVLPARLMITDVPALLEELLRGSQRHQQLALADFMETGQFSRHLRRMRRLYRDRQQALREALSREMTVPCEVAGGHGGMHLLVRLPGCYPDQRIVEAAWRYHIAPAALSANTLHPRPGDNGLILGYGNTPEDRFVPLIQRLSMLAAGLQTGLPAGTPSAIHEDFS